MDPTEAKKIVDRDILELGEWLTVTQTNRERRSVLLVPACTSRSNDYWHAGQASVLASGTATVFCNAVNKGMSVGGSCFIGSDSVQKPSKGQQGIVHLLTPYHGWQRGILQPSGHGALSEADQALVVVDMDPVHLVSGKPRPQLLPEPMSMVAYLPIVEVVRKEDNARALVADLQDQLTKEGCQTLETLLAKVALHDAKDFDKALSELLDEKAKGVLSVEYGGPSLDEFARFFSDPVAVRERILSSFQNFHQQPAPSIKADGLDLAPAWLDFLVADLTWKHPDTDLRGGKRPRDGHPAIRVPPWRPERTNTNEGNFHTAGEDPNSSLI